jgi:hypothetical protein
MDTSYLIEAASRAYDYASDINIKYSQDFDENDYEDFDIDDDNGLDDDIRMSFKL